MAYATHVENWRNLGAWIKNVCAGKLSKAGASSTTQDTVARSEEGRNLDGLTEAECKPD